MFYVYTNAVVSNWSTVGWVRQVFYNYPPHQVLDRSTAQEREWDTTAPAVSYNRVTATALLVAPGISLPLGEARIKVQCPHITCCRCQRLSKCQVVSIKSSTRKKCTRARFVKSATRGSFNQPCRCRNLGMSISTWLVSASLSCVQSLCNTDCFGNWEYVSTSTELINITAGQWVYI